jgi:hypothetical protein
MGVSGQRQAPAAFYTLRKDPPVSIGQETGWAPESVWTQKSEEKSAASAGGGIPIARSTSVRYFSLYHRLSKFISSASSTVPLLYDSKHRHNVSTTSSKDQSFFLSKEHRGAREHQVENPALYSSYRKGHALSYVFLLLK